MIVDPGPLIVTPSQATALARKNRRGLAQGIPQPRRAEGVARAKRGVRYLTDRLLDLFVWLSADGAQMEVRVLAEVSGDKLLIEQLCSGQDIHSLVGHTLTGWAVERIKSEKNTRKMVKNMVFGVVYGLGRDNLYPYVIAKIRAIDGPDADLTGITPDALGKLYDAFFRKYTGVSKYMSDMRAQAETRGFVETLFGFRREIKQKDSSRTTYWANQAINTPIQGTAHQLLLIALALLHMKPKTYNKLDIPVMEVHDALNFYSRLRDLQTAYQQLMHVMTEGVTEYAERAFKRKLRVPLKAEAGAGFTLGSLVDYTGQSPEEFLPAWRIKYAESVAKGWGKLLPAASTV